MKEASYQNPTRTTPVRAVVGVAAIVVIVAGGFFALSRDSTTPAGEPPVDDQQPAVDEAPPEELALVETDVCTASLQDSLAPAESIAVGLRHWSRQLREIGTSAPEDVATALDDLADAYETLAVASEVDEMSEAAQDVFQPPVDPATSQLINDYIAEKCA